MKIILDSSVFINATSFPFSKSNEYFIPSPCEEEIKETLARARFDAAYYEYPISITDPCPATIAIVQELAEEYGVKRLSRADEHIIGLALEISARKEKVKVFTDDYSIQNVLKWRKIPFEGVLQKGIQKAKRFSRKAK